MFFEVPRPSKHRPGLRWRRHPRLKHGKTSPILHAGENVFTGLPSPFEATRYHSLIVKRETLPACLKITAETAEGETMGRDLPVYGVQPPPSRSSPNTTKERMP